MADTGILDIVDSNGPQHQDLPHEYQIPFEPASTRMPAEMWERIIDRLWDEPRALKACQLVCKKWQTRSRFWLDHFRLPVLYNTHDVRQWASWVYEVPRYRGKVNRVEIFGDRGSLERPSAQGVFPGGGLAHMGTFAVMLGGLLPCLREIHIESGDWSASMPHTIYLHLQVFASVTVLSLSGTVRLPSVGAFCRLINALNSLQSILTDAEDTVHFTDHTIREQAPKRLLPPNLSRIEIGDRERRFTQDRRAAEDFYQILSTVLPTACRHLELRCISLGCVQSLSIQRLLWSAGRTLHSLTITLPALDNDLPVVTDIMLPEARRILATTGLLGLVDKALNLSDNTCLKQLHIDLPKNPSQMYHHHLMLQILSHVTPQAIGNISICFDKCTRRGGISATI